MEKQFLLINGPQDTTFPSPGVENASRLEMLIIMATSWISKKILRAKTWNASCRPHLLAYLIKPSGYNPNFLSQLFR